MHQAVRVPCRLGKLVHSILSQLTNRQYDMALRIMFHRASNQPLGSLESGKVIDMTGMLKESTFDEDVGQVTQCNSFRHVSPLRDASTPSMFMQPANVHNDR